MRVAFRVDAARPIGTGHLARCLTLAAALAERGSSSRFVCRLPAGEPEWLDPVRRQGFGLALLQGRAGRPDAGPDAPAHAAWLASGSAVDARETREAIAPDAPLDWLVVDHYGIDRRWEDAVRGCARRLMAIDDLADRDHACDLLLDQNAGRRPEDYASRVPSRSTVLAGPQYALLRPEFAARREASLARRANAPCERILVAMGGVDAPNASGAVLATLARAPLRDTTKIDVILGAQAPWRAEVERTAAGMPWPTTVAAGVSDMAERMAASDLAIGAAGGSAWERCALGLPAIVVVLADNQRPGARALEAAGAARVIASPAEIEARLAGHVAALAGDPNALRAMSARAAALVDGAGVDRVASTMERLADD